MSQTINNPDIPFITKINDGLIPGKMLRIQGLAPANCPRFNINLQCGPNVDPRDDIALHLSVRPSDGYIARNSLSGQVWGEEQGQGMNPISSGQPFEILILTDHRDYKIAINGKHFCEFAHRIPINKVNHLTIDGDVSIKLINFEVSAPPPNVPAANAPPQSAGPPPSYGGPPGPPMYGPPGQPPAGPYGGPPYGGQGPYGPYGPPPPPGHGPDADKGSGLEGFLGQAGAAIAGAFGSAVLQGALSGKQQGPQQPPQAPPPQQQQQPLAGGYGGQSVGGLGSIGTFLTNTLTETLLKPKQQKKKHKKELKAERKAMKKAQKALKYGTPTAGIGFVGYGLHKGSKKHRRHGHHHKKPSSSSSSSSSD